MSAMAQKMQQQTRTIIAGAFGNILEWYDFALYGFLAVVISGLFFPTGNQVTALLSTYGIFAAGFLMRPIGAWLFGYIGDTVGRRTALLLSVLLMGTVTFAFGLLPTYAAIGIWAPILLITLRLLQGLSVGGEFSTSVTYMVERAPQHRRGFTGSFANIGSMTGMLLGVGAATLVTSMLAEPALYAWGWRIPFLFGGLLGIVAILLRHHLPASLLHKEEKRHSAKTPLREALTNNKRELGEALLFSLGYAVFFYIALVYLPTYANEFFNLPLDHALQVNTAAIALSIILIPLFGYLSDTLIQRKNIIIIGFICALIFAVPLFLFIEPGGLWHFALTQFVFVCLVSIPLGIAPALYVELFPTSDRLTAYSITFNVSLGIFGGTAPLVSTWLIHITGNPLMPAYYLMATLVIAIIGIWTIHDRSREPLR